MAIDKTGKLAMDVYNDLKPHQQQFLDNQLISETNPLLEITAMSDTERRWLMYSNSGRNVGKTMMAGAIKNKEELTEQVIVTGVDIGSKEHVINYTIDEADDLMEAMALTMDSMDIYRVRGGVGKHRGPKGGGAQRLAKRRKANKAARKARRHG